MVAATVAIFSSFAIFGKLGSAFMPKADPGQFQVNYKASPSISLERSMEIARQIDALVRTDPGVAYTYTTIGGSGGQPQSEGAIFIRLKDRKERPHYSVIQAGLRERLRRFRGVRTAVVEADQLEADARPVQVVLRGPELTRLAPMASRLIEEVRKVPGATDVDTSEEEPRPEMRIAVDRKAAGDLGLDLGTIASTMRGLVAGEVVSQYEDQDGDSYDVRLRVDPSERVTGLDLLALDLPGQGGGTLIPLSQVASVDRGTAPSKIRHRDLMREIRISANTEGRSLGEVVTDVKDRIGKLQISRRIHGRVHGRVRRHDGELRLRGAGAGAGDRADLRDPGLAVPQLPAAARDHALAAAVAGRRGGHAVPGRTTR